MAGQELAARVEIRVLGPLEVRVDGIEVTVGGRRPRALLGVLAISAGSAVSTDRLAELLWGEDPPASVTNALQVYASNLRRAITPEGSPSLLVSQSGGYCLRVPAEAVDALRFDRTCHLGREQLTNGRPDLAVQTLRAALDLWRGRPLPDLRPQTSADAVVTRLEESRLAALADRIDAEAALGRYAHLVPELEELVALHPLNERFVGQLITAQYHSGQQAGALGTYTAASQRLSDELGVDPSPALRALHRQVLRQELRPARPPVAPDIAGPAPGVTGGTAPGGDLGAPPGGLAGASPGPQAATALAPGLIPGRPPEADPGPSAPGTPLSMPDLALSRTADPATAGPATASPATAGPDGALGSTPPPSPGRARSHRTELRRPRTPLIGRQEELRQALALLADPSVRLLTVVGPGGTGKTRFALEVAQALNAPVVPLAAVAEPADVLPEVCRALGAVPDRADEPAVNVAAAALAGGARLLVLDNLEHLLRDDEPLIELDDLLDQAEDLTLLCTSRTVLRLRGEHVLALPPLPVPQVGCDPDPEEMLRSDAVRLFRDRVRAVQPGFEITPGNAEAVASVCRMVDGLPLALELAAARVRTLPPEQLARRMGNRLSLLTGGARDLPDRHRSMRAALDWSARLLEPVELWLFAQLGIFVGGCTLEAAESVCTVDDGLPDATAGRPATPFSTASPAWPAAPTDPLWPALTASSPLPSPPATPFSTPTPATPPASAPGLDLPPWYPIGQGADADVIDVVERLVDKSLVVPDSSGRLSMLETVREYAAGVLSARADVHPESVRALRRRHAQYYAQLAAQLGPAWRDADPVRRAMLEQETANLTAALHHARDDADGDLLGQLIVNLLDYWFFSGQLAQASRWFEIARNAPVPGPLRTRLVLSRANFALVQGDPAQAQEIFQAAHAEAALLGDIRVVARVLRGLAVAHRYAGALSEALEDLDGAIAAATVARSPAIPELENERAEVLFELGRTEEAVPVFESFRAWLAGEGQDDDLGYALANLALAADETGDDRARGLVEATEAAAAVIDAIPDRAQVLGTVGLLHLRRDDADPEETVGTLRTAVELTHRSGQLLRMPELTCLLGAAHLRAGRSGTAARLLAAGQSWARTQGIRPGRLAAEAVARAEKELAAVLSDDELRAGQVRGSLVPFGSLTGLRDLERDLVVHVDLRPIREPAER